MDLDIHGTAVVRKKIASYKGKIQAADKRTEKAKDNLNRVEESFNRAMGRRTKMEDQICKRDSQLYRVETLIDNLQAKWKVLIRFREETNNGGQREKESGQNMGDIDTDLAPFTKRTKIAEEKYKASVDRELALLEQTERARERCIRLETAARGLQEQLSDIQERVCTLVQRRQSRNTRKLQMEFLEDKVKQTLTRAQVHENLEAELESRIFELEDQIEMFTQKKKRVSSILAERDNQKSMGSWTITLWLRRSSLVTKSSITNFANPNGTTTKDA